jgi:predicted dinucleotide-binding enzyme
MFLSGDDADARAVVSALIDDIGYAPVDLGRLASGSALQQLGGPLAGLDLRLVD